MEATQGKLGDEAAGREIHQQTGADADLLQRKTLRDVLQLKALRDLVQLKVLRGGSLGRGGMCRPSFVPAGSS